MNQRNPTGVDIREVYSDAGIINYPTKTMKGQTKNNVETIPLSKRWLRLYSMWKNAPFTGQLSNRG